MILVFGEVDDGTVTEVSRQAVTAAHGLAVQLGEELHALTLGSAADPAAEQLATHGVDVVHQAHHDLLEEYGPEAWGAALSQVIAALEPDIVLAGATDRGSEVMAHAAARQDLPLVANVSEFRHVTEGPLQLTRVRWGGSLLEHTELDAPVALVTTAAHAFEARVLDQPPTTKAEVFTPELDQRLARSQVADRVVTASGVTLAEAPVVVGGGRGVGSAEGFAPLEELAELLGGRVGCSRVATNAGWRPHADQVGQTGTAIAPQLYIACGISGAIQHWAGAKGAKHVLAINTDPDANMVARADYAVIGDLHEVVPAIVDALRARTA